jgi:hypothetical protein
LFLAGSWETLNDRSSQQEIARDSQIEKKAIFHAALGEFSKAISLLQEEGEPVKIDDVRARQLKEKHPRRSYLLDQKTDLFEGNVFSEADFNKALRRSANGSAPGLSGWSYTHFKTLFDVEQTSVLYRITHILAKGHKLDPKIGPFVFGAKEFGLDKNEGADIRPISVTEALFRLVGKSICIAYSDEWKEFFQPFQFAIATPRGIETFIHLFRNDMEIDQNVVTSIDAENAFSSIFRSAVLEQLRKHYPILVPFFLSVYGEHSNLRVHHYSGKIEWIKCDEGLLQGDPLSVFYFALATQSIHRRISEKFEVRIAAYVDDTNFISSKKKIKQVVDSYKLEYNKIGLKIKEKKSFHYDPHDQLQKSEFPITRKGFRCLGAPLGSQDYEKDFRTEKWSWDQLRLPLFLKTSSLASSHSSLPAHPQTVFFN